MRILLGYFSAQMRGEENFKLTLRNESFHETNSSSSNDIRIVNFAMSKNLIVKNTMFLHCKINKYAWT
jgi:hypothetical protein